MASNLHQIWHAWTYRLYFLSAIFLPDSYFLKNTFTHDILCKGLAKILKYNVKREIIIIHFLNIFFLVNSKVLMLTLTYTNTCLFVCLFPIKSRFLNKVIKAQLVQYALNLNSIAIFSISDVDEMPNFKTFYENKVIWIWPYVGPFVSKWCQ